MSRKYLLYRLSKLSSGCSDNTPDRNNLRGESLFGLTVSESFNPSWGRGCVCLSPQQSEHKVEAVHTMMDQTSNEQQVRPPEIRP